MGLQDPARLDECESITLTGALVDALTQAQRWLDKAIELLPHRADYQRLWQWPRMGQPTVAAILTAIGDMHTYQHGKQLVKLAGREPRLLERGTSIRKLPKISHVGRAYLRYWLYHYARRLIAHGPHVQAYDQRRTQPSPGKGSGQRALIAVCDKTLRMLYRILLEHAPDNPKQDKSIAESYAAQRKAA